MKLTQEPRVSLGVNIVQVSVVGGLVIGALAAAFFLFGGMFSSQDSMAANSVVANGVKVKSSNSPFTSLSSGDTITINGKFEIDQDYTLHSNNVIVLVIDGTNAELKVKKDNKIVLGTGSSIALKNGGQLTSTGGCISTSEIYFGSSLVANCPGTGASSFSAVNSGGGIGANGVVLPVSWLDVEARSTGEMVEIRWSTASEKNNSHFQIEFSDDGEFWNTGPQINSRADNGFSEEILEYTAQHYPPAFMDQIYYRIKQVDYDGKFDYSDAMIVRIEQSQEVVVSTLGNQQIKVNCTAENPEETYLNIYYDAGMSVLSEKLDPQHVINLPHAGIYVVEVISGSVVKRLKHYIK